MKKVIAILLTAIAISTVNSAQRETCYQDVWCKGMNGKVEHRLEDGRRIDCLTKNNAIEIEFAHKWPEAIGQSPDYSMLTGKQAGIVLIIRKHSDLEHWNRLNKVISYYQLPVKLWKLGP